MKKTPVFSCVEYIQDAADRFFAISDALHRRLAAGGFHGEPLNDTLEIYGVLRILCITSFSAFPTQLNQQVTSANLSEIGVMQRLLNG